MKRKDNPPSIYIGKPASSQFSRFIRSCGGNLDTAPKAVKSAAFKRHKDANHGGEADTDCKACKRLSVYAGDSI